MIEGNLKKGDFVRVVEEVEVNSRWKPYLRPGRVLRVARDFHNTGEFPFNVFVSPLQEWVDWPTDNSCFIRPQQLSKL